MGLIPNFLIGPFPRLKHFAHSRPVRGERTIRLVATYPARSNISSKHSSRRFRQHRRIAGQPIDRLLATHPYYIPSIIPGGMYVGNPGDVPTIGTRAVLLASYDRADEVVYALVKAVADNFAVFRQ